jgi:2-methylcitrate dehydratase PrpD
MAPCACQGNKTTVWTYVSKDGTTTKEYPSEIQARAAVVRNNGGKVVAKAT